MRSKIEQGAWPRKDHFLFFNNFEEPYFSITANVDCTIAYRKAKDLNVSFFLYYLHCSLTAVNQTEAFRYRVIDNEVFIYDEVHASATVMRPNGTFGFSYIEFNPSLAGFMQAAREEISRVQASTGLTLLDKDENLIHYSAIPWINFTAITHARSFSYRDSVPKISFGKADVKDGVRTMPVSITVHHGLVDAMQVGQHLGLFQQLLNQ